MLWICLASSYEWLRRWFFTYHWTRPKAPNWSLGGEWSKKMRVQNDLPKLSPHNADDIKWNTNKMIANGKWPAIITVCTALVSFLIGCNLCVCVYLLVCSCASTPERWLLRWTHKTVRVIGYGYDYDYYYGIFNSFIFISIFTNKTLWLMDKVQHFNFKLTFSFRQNFLKPTLKHSRIEFGTFNIDFNSIQ